MDFIFLAQLILSGILVGGIYSLLALGIVLIYKASGVLNFAQGDMTALGAFFAWWLASIAVSNGLPYVPLMILGVVVLAYVVATGIEYFILRPLIGQPIIATLMSTIALGMIMSGSVTMAWPGPGRVFPPMIPGGELQYR